MQALQKSTAPETYPALHPEAFKASVHPVALASQTVQETAGAVAVLKALALQAVHPEAVHVWQLVGHAVQVTAVADPLL